MSDTITIGVDHGYAAMKTTHCAFPTGLVGYDNEPYTQKDVLEYGGRFYVVGSGRQPLQKDKTATEDYYLLTLAAIAKELAHRGAEPTAAVHLAAGLPLTSFGRDKKKFRAYLLRDGKPVSFRYEGIAYTVTIAEVSLFPQGYAAVLTQQELLDEPSGKPLLFDEENKTSIYLLAKDEHSDFVDDSDFSFKSGFSKDKKRYGTLV